MIKKITVVLLHVLFTQITFAQAPAIQWQKTLGGTSSDDANSVQQTSDGGYIVAGYSYSTDVDVTGNHGGRDYWIVKLNSNGVIEWQKSLGGSSDDHANFIQQTSEGGYIVVGYSSSNDGDVIGNHGGSDYWIVKLDSNGDIQWQKSLGGSLGDFASSIQQTSDGGYVVAGFSLSNDGDVTGNNIGDYWLVKLTNSGNIQWQKTLGASIGSAIQSIRQTSDGGYIVTGTSTYNAVGNHGASDYWIAKLDNNGSIQWQKYFGGSGYDLVHSVQQTSDGGYIMVGNSASVDGDVTGNHGFYDAWIVKLNSAGVIQWQKSIGGSAYDNAFSIQQTSDGGYILEGYSVSNDGDVIGNHGAADAWVVKISSNGIVQWHKSLGGNNSDYGQSIQQTSDGGYILAGFSNSTNGDVANGTHGNNDYWIVKLSPDNLSTNEASNKNSITVENPIKDKLNIQSKEKITSLQLFSLEGKLIRTSNCQDMPVAEIEKGIYILKIQLKNGNTISKKLIKE